MISVFFYLLSYTPFWVLHQLLRFSTFGNSSAMLCPLLYKPLIIQIMKNNLLKGSMVLLCLMLISPWVRGQDVESWTFLKEKDGIKVFYQEISCTNDSKILFKIQNSSNSAKELMWYGFIKNGDESGASLNTMLPQIFEPAQEKFGSCEDGLEINLSLPTPLNFVIEYLSFEITLI